MFSALRKLSLVGGIAGLLNTPPGRQLVQKVKTFISNPDNRQKAADLAGKLRKTPPVKDATAPVTADAPSTPVPVPESESGMTSMESGGKRVGDWQRASAGKLVDAAQPAVPVDALHGTSPQRPHTDPRP